MQQQGYDKLSQDMQEALDNAVKLINGNIDTLNQTAGAMLKQLEENNVDELGIINGIVEGTGTKIHGETHQMLDETLTERQALSENAMNMANGISAIAMLLGQTPSEMANSLYEIVNQLGDNGTLSQAIKMFASENGIQIDGTSLEGIVSSITAPFDKDGEAMQLFDDIYDSVAEGGSTVFSEASGMKGAINTMAGLLGKDADSVYTRMQQIIDDLGPTGTFSQAMKQYIDQENIKLDERTSQMLDELVAPYDQGGQAQYLMTQIKDSLTGETGVLKLLSDLGVTKTTDEEGNPDWKIDFSSIDWKPVTKAISELNPKVNITLNSDNKDIKDKLDKIEEEVLSLKSPGGTNGETGKGNEPVADVGEIEKLEEQKRQQQEDIQNQITANLEELSKKDKDLAELQKKINELTTSHTMYNDKINAKKERLKEAKKNNEGTKKYEQIRQQISSLRTTRDAVAGEEAATVRAFNDLLAEINRDKARIAQMEEELKALSSFSSGSKRISKKQLAWTNENMNSLGAEMIVRKSDGAILTPLKADDSVIPANLADNLFKWGAISPDKFLSNPFLGKMGDIPQSATVNNQVDQQVQMHFDSLFTIQGNVDSDVMDRLEEFGKALTSNRNFQQNVVKFVTKDFVRESKKQGGFR